jgi:iron complex transport system substrate-binding protein
MMSVDAEKLIALKPEIVYINDINVAGSESVWQQVADAGITVVNIPTSSSIKDIQLDVQFIADSLAEHEKGRTASQRHANRDRSSCQNWQNN